MKEQERREGEEREGKRLGTAWSNGRVENRPG